MSLLSKTVGSCCTLLGLGWVATDELYAVSVDRPLEAGVHLLVLFYFARPNIALLCEPHWLHGDS